MSSFGCFLRGFWERGEVRGERGHLGRGIRGGGRVELSVDGVVGLGWAWIL